MASGFVEFAHTPQFPHLGILRMMIEADRIAREQSGTLLFCINDHLPPRSLPECRQLPLWDAQGREIANSASLGLSKVAGKFGMHCLPAPDSAGLQAFVARWAQLQPDAAHRVQEAGEQLAQWAKEAVSLADWFVRIMVGVSVCGSVDVLMTSQLSQRLSEPFKKILEGYPELFWAHCPRCGYRHGRWSEAGTSDPCRLCGECLASDPIPDVVARQVIVNHLGIAARVCGRSKDYQEQADALSLKLGLQVPPRIRCEKGTQVLFSSGMTAMRMNALQLWVGRGKESFVPPQKESTWSIVYN